MSRFLYLDILLDVWKFKLIDTISIFGFFEALLDVTGFIGLLEKKIWKTNIQRYCLLDNIKWQLVEFIGC